LQIFAKIASPLHHADVCFIFKFHQNEKPSALILPRLMKVKSVFLSGRFGFTLVELLVVIAIVGLLAGLAIPAINRALDSASDSEDLNNLKQIGQGIGAYTVQTGGRIPYQHLYIEGADINGAPRANFREAVDRMFPPDKKFSTTSVYNWNRRPVWFSKRHAKNPPGKNPDPGAIAWGSAWGINSNLYSSANFEGYLNRAPNLSGLVIVGEINENQNVVFMPNDNPVFTRNEATRYRISRNGSAFYLFGDLHVEKIAGDQSTLAHPEYNKDNSTNRLYYKWW